MNDMDVGDKAMPAREGSRVRFQGGADGAGFNVFSKSFKFAHFFRDISVARVDGF